MAWSRNPVRLRVLDLVFLAVFCVCVDASSVFTFSVSSDSAAACTATDNVSPSCSSHGDTRWTMPERATVPGPLATFVDLDQHACSDYLMCSAFDFQQHFSAAWGDAAVSSFALGLDYETDAPADLYLSVSIADSQVSSENMISVSSTGSSFVLVVTPTQEYGVSLPLTQLDAAGTGMRVWAEAGVQSPEISVDHLVFGATFSGPVSVTGVTPAAADVGDVITITGSFYPTHELGEAVSCVFSPPGAATVAVPAVRNTTRTQVVCAVPDMGVQSLAVPVSASLDSGSSVVDSTAVLAYREEPVDVLLVVLVAGGSVLGLIGAAAAVVFLARRHDSSSSNKADDVSKLEPPLSTASSLGATPRVRKPSVQRGYSASAPGSGRAGVSNRQRKRKQSNRSAGASEPAAFESTPIAEFRVAAGRQSMMTEYSVTSEQAPYFASDP